MNETPNWVRFARRKLPTLGRAFTKIVATIGPASEPRIDELIDAGMNVARINLSHGDEDDVRRRIAALRAASARKGIPLGILADIRGPKLRLGFFPQRTLDLEEGQLVWLIEGGGMAEPGRIPIDFPGLLESVEKGQRVLLADGAAELVVEEKDSGGLHARVVRAGTIGDAKGVHLPDSRLSQMVPTEEDRRDLELCRELDVDLVGVSFVSRAEEITAVRACVPDALVVAKIERVTALENLEQLLDAADGVMVARGDLGVEMELEQLPMVQKTLIQAALRSGKFTITATEMLESMVHSSRPTRAEVTDVANAVLDGTDAVMLSAETAVGKYPVEAVEAMQRIARAVEASQRYHDLPRVGFRSSEPTFSNAVALAAAQAAEALGVERIICFTETGNTPRQLSRYRPHAEVFALSPHMRTLRHMSILAHVRPMEFPHKPTLEDMLD
ncbi:MAG: pyruvate kinase, partial [Planctomycetes bacterium]|nr:pyruvate kinase [Planctomycetota bacterium]